MKWIRDPVEKISDPVALFFSSMVGPNRVEDIKRIFLLFQFLADGHVFISSLIMLGEIRSSYGKHSGRTNTTCSSSLNTCTSSAIPLVIVYTF